MHRSGPFGPSGKSWFWAQLELAPDWTMAVDIRPTGSFAVWLSLTAPSFEIDLGILRFNIGHYPEPELTAEEWEAIDRFTAQMSATQYTTETHCSGTGTATYYAMFLPETR